MERIYGWLFTYNIYNKIWYAYHRDDARGYWNNDGTNKRTIYEHEDINELLKIVTNGEDNCS